VQNSKVSGNSSDITQASQKLAAVAPIDATDVVAWLRTHTDFFLEYPELLAVLALPNESGSTISFAQRQATLLRKRNSDLRGRLQALLANAETNDALFGKTRALSLTLQRAESQKDLNSAFENDLVQAFAADHLACYLLGNPGTGRGMIRWTDKYPLSELFDPDAARCVTLRTRELDQLFPIGSDNRERFSNDMGMLFVDFIGELVDVTVQRLLRTPDAPD